MAQTIPARLAREQRRQQLLDVALSLIVNGGFAALSMEGLAREAGIAKTVVYSQFGDVRTLLRTLLQRAQDHVAQAIATAARPPADATRRGAVDALVAPVTSLLRDARSHPDTWRLILLSPEGSPAAFRSALEDHRVLVLEQARPVVVELLVRAGLSTLDVDLANRSVLAMLENLARLVLSDPAEYSVDRVSGFVAAAAATLIDGSRQERA